MRIMRIMCGVPIPAMPAAHCPLPAARSLPALCLAIITGAIWSFSVYEIVGRSHHLPDLTADATVKAKTLPWSTTNNAR